MVNGTSGGVMGAVNEVVSSGTCAGGPRPRKGEGDLYRTCSALHEVCLSDCLPAYLSTYLPISAHLVKINNYDETYEAPERPADDPLDYVETGIKARGYESFINRSIPPVKHSRQHNRAAVGEPGFSRRWIYTNRASFGATDCSLRDIIIVVRVNLESISNPCRHGFRHLFVIDLCFIFGSGTREKEIQNVYAAMGTLKIDSMTHSFLSQLAVMIILK